MSVPVRDEQLLAALEGQNEIVELVKPTGEPLGLFMSEAEYTRLVALLACPVRSPEEAARERSRVWAEVEAGRVWTTSEAIAEAKRRAGLSGSA